MSRSGPAPHTPHTHIARGCGGRLCQHTPTQCGGYNMQGDRGQADVNICCLCRCLCRCVCRWCVRTSTHEGTSVSDTCRRRPPLLSSLSSLVRSRLSRTWCVPACRVPPVEWDRLRGPSLANVLHRRTWTLPGRAPSLRCRAVATSRTTKTSSALPSRCLTTRCRSGRCLTRQSCLSRVRLPCRSSQDGIIGFLERKRYLESMVGPGIGGGWSVRRPHRASASH